LKWRLPHNGVEAHESLKLPLDADFKRLGDNACVPALPVFAGSRNWRVRFQGFGHWRYCEELSRRLANRNGIRIRALHFLSVLGFKNRYRVPNPSTTFDPGINPGKDSLPPLKFPHWTP
jgi:hypothetical protein